MRYLQAKHQKLVDEELERVSRANAKNDVEAFVFAAREKLTSDGMDQVSIEEAREEISTKLSAAEDWLWEDGDNVEVQVYKEKLTELKGLVADIFYRFVQLTDRPLAITSFKEAIADARKRVTDWIAR